MSSHGSTRKSSDPQSYKRSNRMGPPRTTSSTTGSHEAAECRQHHNEPLDTLTPCRFVCTAAKETRDITRLRSYDLRDRKDTETTILEAALATSAATRYFDTARIGARQFVDGAFGANNPVEQVEREATDVWCDDTADLMPQVKCFVSVGTGRPARKPIEDNILKLVSKTLVAIVTETEQTEARFIARWRHHYDNKRYFRFSVDRGLEGIRLEHYHEQGTMEAATETYLSHTAQIARVRDCVLNLKQKQSVYTENLPNNAKELAF